MNVRYYLDPDTGQPHIYNHNVREVEVEQVLRRPGEDRLGKGGSRVAIGQTDAGRYLRVIYVPDPKLDSVFVITAFELVGGPLTAYRRRRRKEMKQTKFPPGWDENRVREVLAHYETLTEEEAVAEDEAASEDSSQTLMEVPNGLVPEVRELIARRAS